MAKYIFITGGVISSLGKGINGSSIGVLLKSRGYKVFMQKFDPYINVDPHYISPLQHGEIFVTEDGTESDLDLGHYERFIDENLSCHSSVTTGKIYMRVLTQERNNGYGGKTVQIIPHITDAIKECVYDAAAASEADFIITEVGGTVGDIESLPFLEAIRQIRRDVGFENTFYVHNTLVPYLAGSKEIKTKPTQHSVKELRSIGIVPDMIVLRSCVPIPMEQKEKIALFCDVDINSVIVALDVKSVYDIPLNLYKQKTDEVILKHFNMPLNTADLDYWKQLINQIKNLKGQINIGILGAHVALPDAYISITEAIKHAGIHLGKGVNIVYLDPNECEPSSFEKLDGIVISGEYDRDLLAKYIPLITAIRESGIPALFIADGFSLGIIEYARVILGHDAASTQAISPRSRFPLFVKYEGQNPVKFQLGVRDIVLEEGSQMAKIYHNNIISERVRYIYGFNGGYVPLFDKTPFQLTGFNDSTDEAMFFEMTDHKFYCGTIANPEFRSRPTRAHELFIAFLEASVNKEQNDAK